VRQIVALTQPWESCLARARRMGAKPSALQWSRPGFAPSSLCGNSESARFCSARLLSGHSSYRHDPQCPLERRALQNCASIKFSHRLSGAGSQILRIPSTYVLGYALSPLRGSPRKKFELDLSCQSNCTPLPDLPDDILSLAGRPGDRWASLRKKAAGRKVRTPWSSRLTLGMKVMA
jgi:hypothetical protein